MTHILNKIDRLLFFFPIRSLRWNIMLSKIVLEPITSHVTFAFTKKGVFCAHFYYAIKKDA